VAIDSLGNLAWPLTLGAMCGRSAAFSIWSDSTSPSRFSLSWTASEATTPSRLTRLFRLLPRLSPPSLGQTSHASNISSSSTGTSFALTCALSLSLLQAPTSVVELALVIVPSGANVISGLQPNDRRWLLDLYSSSCSGKQHLGVIKFPPAFYTLPIPPTPRPPPPYFSSHDKLQRVSDSTPSHALSPATDIPIFNLYLRPSLPFSLHS
jgi:hypothetical protein